MKSTRKHIDYVNVFQGSGAIDLPEPQGIAKKWLFIKAQCGNTHPGAAYPFGKMTVLPYTGGYPDGYGNHRPNTCGQVTTFDAKVRGFSHIHHSGTGGIRAHYNYALTLPVKELGVFEESIVCEYAKPGYYSAKLSSGAFFEATVTNNIALHRYKLSGERYIQIDFSNYGLHEDFGSRGNSYEGCDPNAEVRIISDNLVVANATFYGITLYFAAECKNASKSLLWRNYSEQKSDAITAHDGKFGAAFCVSDTADLRLAISFSSSENAVKMLEDEPASFDKVRALTFSAWDTALSKISIETEDEDLKEIFYSNLYHTLIKPCTGCGESFLYEVDGRGEFCFDLATLWDMYKTVLPLIFSIYPEISKEVIETLIRSTTANGHSLINLTIAKDNDFNDQAKMLAEYCFYDYYIRGGKEYGKRMLEAADIDYSYNKDFVEGGFCERYTQILDAADAFGAMAELAKMEGDEVRFERFSAVSRYWINAFDNDTGLMSSKSKYYEGDLYNYSFRPLRNMNERISIKGREKFISDLDGFFGFTREDVVQPKVPEEDPLKLGVHSFEGFNNESDMETPFAYSLAGEHKKTCEIMRAGMKYMFTKGKGGLPGNNDSGGLSSLYVWSVLGLFPVSGQDLMLIGSPACDGGEMLLANGNKFRIKVYGNSDENIYVERAVLNGRELNELKFSVSEMFCGGTLEIYMTDK